MANEGEADEQPSQRSMLWRIADARPIDLGRWVREAPGRTPREVITHVLRQWQGLRTEVGVDVEDDPGDREVERRAAIAGLSHIRDVIRGDA